MKQNILIFFIVLIFNSSCDNSSNSYYANSIKLKKGMGINETIKHMNGQPSNISDVGDRYSDKNLRLRLIYIDTKKHSNIHVYFDSNFKLYKVDYLD